MLAETYLHNLIAAVCPIDGLRFVSPVDADKWPSSSVFTTADGLTCVVDHSANATSQQQTAIASVVNPFNYTTAESLLNQIQVLENSVTSRIRDEATAGDTTINPAWCGGAGGTAQQHITWLVGQKNTLRSQLPK